MKVSYLTDQQVRAEYLKLLNRLEDHIASQLMTPDTEFDSREDFWSDLGYLETEIPEV